MEIAVGIKIFLKITKKDDLKKELIYIKPKRGGFFFPKGRTKYQRYLSNSLSFSYALLQIKREKEVTFSLYPIHI